ncbi:hypothetical protein KUTeg_012725 [Tegillarca granosa]|uniref:Uncharacterized protein n=1 Tax=Tegillarca granosa TaxID=220873 RepID=A0ABQ9F5M2_TEGGR|nr:hypothetical protein KUTeg_012725 [Tegillarca granosa]
MKEKLLMTDVAADLFETDPEVEDYGIESNYTVTSTDGQIMARNFHNSVSNGQYQNGRQYQTEEKKFKFGPFMNHVLPEALAFCKAENWKIY